MFFNKVHTKFYLNNVLPKASRAKKTVKHQQHKSVGVIMMQAMAYEWKVAKSCVILERWTSERSFDSNMKFSPSGRVSFRCHHESHNNEYILLMCCAPLTDILYSEQTWRLYICLLLKNFTPSTNRLLYFYVVSLKIPFF